ncbi:hypothetical protein ABFS83_11G020700 [Erythranthe nasuta]
MVWCSSCGTNIIRPDNVDGKICCSLCGRVLDEDNFSQEPQFTKNASGQSQLSGRYMKTIQAEYSLSRERTRNEAYDGICHIMNALNMDGGDSIANAALNIYTIALERNFTRGRRRELVQAACLYITCRVNKKPYLLIDFSEHLRMNVYVLGAVFLQLCQLLSLVEHPIVKNPVDPSLFIHRFTDRLFGGRKPIVARTALLLVASMKRDWMQTGRKPSGICGVALYVSALAHGLKCSKSEITKVVHICEATLTKRLIEFENTESGGLTIDEFNTKAEEDEKEENMISPSTGLNDCRVNELISEPKELICEHKGSGEPPFALSLCKSCYGYFIKLSGGLNKGSEPPAFQRAEMERKMAEENAAENQDTLTLHGSTENMAKNFTSDEWRHAADVTFEESESLSDIDDLDVDIYLHTEKEKEHKKIIWEELNKEYLEEQAAKEAAALAAKKAYEANFLNCSGDVQAAQKLAAAAAEAVAKTKKERQQKRAADAKNAGPAKSAAEAAKQMLDKKRLSSKIRYDELEKIFADTEEENTENTKKTQVETETDPHNKYSTNSTKGIDENNTDMEEYNDGNLDDYNEDMEEEDNNWL